VALFLRRLLLRRVVRRLLLLLGRVIQWRGRLLRVVRRRLLLLVIRLLLRHLSLNVALRPVARVGIIPGWLGHQSGSCPVLPMKDTRPDDPPAIPHLNSPPFAGNTLRGGSGVPVC
jgi:hypothetical protein